MADDRLGTVKTTQSGSIALGGNRESRDHAERGHTLTSTTLKRSLREITRVSSGPVNSWPGATAKRLRGSWSTASPSSQLIIITLVHDAAPHSQRLGRSFKLSGTKQSLRGFARRAWEQFVARLSAKKRTAGDVSSSYRRRRICSTTRRGVSSPSSRLIAQSAASEV